MKTHREGCMDLWRGCYDWLSLATIDLVGDYKEFEVLDIFSGDIPILSGQ